MAASAGVLVGTSTSVFLWLLEWATQTRQTYPFLFWGLPFAGLAIGYSFRRWGGRAASGIHLILEEIHDPKKTIPLRMAPMILIGTIVTHLFGGSAGREGTAVQMGGSLADCSARFFGASGSARRSLLMAGMGAGFGSAIGAPIAGVVFGLEVLRNQKRWLDTNAFLECSVSSLAALLVTQLLHAPHSEFRVSEGVFDIVSPVKLTWTVVISGVAFGLAARAFVYVTQTVERLFARFGDYRSWDLRPFLGGLALVALYHLEGSHRFAGLGIETIQDALSFPSPWELPALKTLFTALTVGTGFKGGEFIPLVFIGTTLGSFLASSFGLPIGLLAGIGFSSTFGAAAKTPLACAIMATEIFGLSIAPLALASGYIANLTSGSLSIYRKK